jgi:hypothetical protein
MQSHILSIAHNFFAVNLFSPKFLNFFRILRLDFLEYGIN